MLKSATSHWASDRNRLPIVVAFVACALAMTIGYLPAPPKVALAQSAAPAAVNVPAGPQTTGGPDAAGYTFKDSLETGCPVNFVSIVTPAANLNLSDDSSSPAQNLGFTFRFYGTDFTQAFAGSNGFVSFGSGSSILTNQCLLPSATTPNNLIAGIWDDLLPSGTNNVYFQAFTAGNCPGGRSGACAIFEWNAVPYFSAGGSTTFQIILRDTAPVTEDIVEIQLQVAAQTGSGSTTGIENSTGTIGLTYFAAGTSCNTVNSILTPRAVYFMPLGVTSCLGAAAETATPTATATPLPTNTPLPTATPAPQGFTGAVGGFGMGEVSLANEPAAVAETGSRLPAIFGGLLVAVGAALAWAVAKRR